MSGFLGLAVSQAPQAEIPEGSGPGAWVGAAGCGGGSLWHETRPWQIRGVQRGAGLQNGLLQPQDLWPPCEQGLLLDRGEGWSPRSSPEKPGTWAVAEHACRPNSAFQGAVGSQGPSWPPYNSPWAGKAAFLVLPGAIWVLTTLFMDHTKSSASKSACHRRSEVQVPPAAALAGPDWMISRALYSPRARRSCLPGSKQPRSLVCLWSLGTGPGWPLGRQGGCVGPLAVVGLWGREPAQ